MATKRSGVHQGKCHNLNQTNPNKTKPNKKKKKKKKNQPTKWGGGEYLRSKDGRPTGENGAVAKHFDWLVGQQGFAFGQPRSQFRRG